MTFYHEFIETFVPLFIVLDALGNLPVIMTLTEGLTKEQCRHQVTVAILTATLVGLAFLFFGQLILNLMGISVPAFAVAGGIILLVLSINYMTTGRYVTADKEEMMAVVLIGTPLIVGPATITTLLLLVTQYSSLMVLLSFGLNIAITWFVFTIGDKIAHFLGVGGMRAISKVFALLLAAIGVNMIFRALGMMNIIKV